MQKNRIALVGIMVVACVSGAYLLKRHSIGGDTDVDGHRTGQDVALQVKEPTKSGDRANQSSGGWAPKSHSEKLKAALPADLNPGKADKLLAEFIAKNPDPEDQDVYAIILMEKLCDNGYSKEAWSLIPQEEGQLRSTLIEAYLGYADLPSDQLLGKLSMVGGDTGRGLRGYLRRFNPTEIDGVISSEGVREFLKNMKPEDRRRVHLDSIVRDALSFKLTDSVNSNFVIINAAAEMNAKGRLAAEHFIDILSTDETTNAFDKWGLLQGINPSSIKDKEDKNQFLKSRDRFISAMIKENAPETMNQMLKSGDAYKDHDLAAALNSWIDIHSSEPSTWFVSNRDKMTPQQQTVAADTFVSKALKAGEFEGARQWAREIPDDARRTKTLNAIDAKESGKARAGK